VDPEIDVVVEGNTLTQLIVLRMRKNHRAMHGLYRSLINNMVEGVSKGFEMKLELVGVGYRAENKVNYSTWY
jgi:large subunit ribosomal protein L6